MSRHISEWSTGSHEFSEVYRQDGKYSTVVAWDGDWKYRIFIITWNNVEIVAQSSAIFVTCAEAQIAAADKLAELLERDVNRASR